MFIFHRYINFNYFLKMQFFDNLISMLKIRKIKLGQKKTYKSILITHKDP